jgi:tungstate transport system ATP-binding protein
MIQGQRLATRVGVIMGGKMVQVGTLHDIFYQPREQDIARFVGIDTTLHGIVQENDRGLATIAVGKALFEVVTSAKPGQNVELFIRPEEVVISHDAAYEPGKSSIRNHFDGTIRKMVPFGPFIRVTADCGFSITSLITTRSCEELGLSLGTHIRVSIKASAIHVVPAAG